VTQADRTTMIKIAWTDRAYSTKSSKAQSSLIKITKRNYLTLKLQRRVIYLKANRQLNKLSLDLNHKTETKSFL